MTRTLEKVEKYLKLIKFDRATHGELKVDLECLTVLHQLHVCAISYENLDVFLGKKIVLDL